MKRFLRLLVATVILTGCTGNTSPSVDPDWAREHATIANTIEIGRALVRVGIKAELKKRGVPDAAVDDALGTMHKIGDDLLAGRNVADIVKDPALWASFRDVGVKTLAGYVTTAFPVIDQATAEFFIGQAFDLARDLVKRKLESAHARVQTLRHGSIRPTSERALVCPRMRSGRLWI